MASRNKKAHLVIETPDNTESSSSSDEASEEERAPPPILHRCALCGRMTSSVFLQLPAGRWANLPMDQRMLCDSCEAAE